MKADEIARYLQDNPKFFDEYADLLAQLYIPHPHGGRAISITERQILTLREKAKQLEGKLGELIRFGEENDVIGEKVHRLAVGTGRRARLRRRTARAADAPDRGLRRAARRLPAVERRHAGAARSSARSPSRRASSPPA
jgi:uncharacterized protein YigA (DUF484 family)